MKPDLVIYTRPDGTLVCPDTPEFGELTLEQLGRLTTHTDGSPLLEVLARTELRWKPGVKEAVEAELAHRKLN